MAGNFFEKEIVETKYKRYEFEFVLLQGKRRIKSEILINCNNQIGRLGKV